MSRTNRMIQAASVLLLFASAAARAQSDGSDAALGAIERKIEQGQHSAVEREILDFVVKNQNNARGYELLARVRSRQDRFTEARSLSLRALALNPKLLDTKLDLAVIELRLGRKDDGRSQLAEIAASSISPEQRLKLAQAYVLFGENREALASLESLPVKMRNTAALPIRVIAHLDLGEDDKLPGLVRMAVKLAAKDPRTAVKVADALAGTRANAGAVQVLRSVVAAHPKNIEAHLLMAETSIFARKFDDANRQIARAKALSPGSADVLFMEGALAAEQGHHQKALALFEESLARDSSRIETMRQIAIVAIKTRQPPRAIEIARTLMKLRPDQPEFVYLYGAATLQMGRDQEAEEYLSRYVVMRPGDSRGCVALGIAMVSQPAKVAAGRSRLEECLRSDPRSFEAAYQLGVSYKDAGESQIAIQKFEETLAIVPKFQPALRDLGTLRLQAGDLAEARRLLEQAAVLAPDDAGTHFQLSRLYSLTGEPERAKTHFEKFRALRPGNDQ